MRRADALLGRVEAHAAARRASGQVLKFASSTTENRRVSVTPPTDSALAPGREQPSGGDTAAVAAATATVAVRTAVAVVAPARTIPPPPLLQLSKLPSPVVEEGRPDAQPPTPIGEVIARITGDPGAEHELRARYNEHELRSRAGLSDAAPEQLRSAEQLRRDRAEEDSIKLRGCGPSTAAAAAAAAAAAVAALAPPPEAERLQCGAAATQDGAVELAGRGETGLACVDPRAGGCYQCSDPARSSASTVARASGGDPLYSSYSA
jgi:hypothetical protein